MSVYYRLACDECKTCVPFVLQSFPARWGWMISGPKNVSNFVGQHVAHIGALLVVSEHDSKYDDFTDVSEAEHG